ncbi:MAG: IS30 family transposase [Myxococcales bacterium]|nr:IS30 family transposase [Myxococcales bacterium]
MRKRKRRKSDRAGRPAMHSPGRPSVARREEQQAFWKAIAAGLSSEDAAVSCGVSPPVGVRWFRQGGGMAPIGLAPRSGRYLSFAEREEIAILKAQGASVRDIARRLGRAPSTISRELRRNAATRSGGFEYRASTAQWHSDRRAKRPKKAKLAVNDRLRSYVQRRLAGTITTEGRSAVSGPKVGPWKGRRHGPRQDRRWSSSWSPQQIANRLPIEYPDDDSMRISHEAIYQALYIQGRGALRRELTACLRTGRALRMPRARRRRRGKGFVSPEIMISERPAEAADRAVPGHWEGDLIIGLGHSAIGTLVERTTRFTMLLHLPRMDDYGGPRAKNGPALAGHGAEAVRDAITSAMTTLPEQLRRSLTWDQGTEMAQHAQLRIDTGLRVFFCDPQSPWQRGTNENTNGLLRQYFPKGTDLSRHGAGDLEAVAATLNSRPRRTLNWNTPAEAFNELLLSLQ